MLHDYLLPDECYHHYTDADTGMALPQGRGTGGGSTVNSAAALRGQPWCFDGWQVPGWSWPECLRRFRAIESDQQFGNAEYHAGRPIPITRLAPGPLDEAFGLWCAAHGSRRPRTTTRRRRSASAGGPRTATTGAGGATHAAVLPLVRSTVDIRPDTEVRRLGLRCRPLRRR